MKKEHAIRFVSVFAFGIAATLIAAPAAIAQEPAKADQTQATPSPVSPATPSPQHGQEEMAETGALSYEPLQVGDATQGLLAWQRSGDIASPTPRPIDGAVANRSYERYVKSFEFPIPERMGSIVKSSSGSGAGGPK